MSALGASIAYVTYNPGGPFMRSLRAGFADAGVHPAHLIVVSPRERLATEWRRRRLGVLTHLFLPRARDVARARFGGAGSAGAPGHDPEIVRVPSLNGPEMVDVIRQRGIRYLVNGGAGIFREPLVSLPDLVIVNAHAGRLPAFRNMNVVEWALYTGAPVVGTVHRIDAGIDTGAIMLERPIDLGDARSVEEARATAFDQVARLVGPAVVSHAQGTLEERPQPAEGTRWYVMHPRLREQLEQRLSRGG
jgi:Formyl transferase